MICFSVFSSSTVLFLAIEMFWTCRCELIVDDDENEEERLQRTCAEAARSGIPQGALELAQSFRVFHKLMITSREIFKKASANIALYTRQQKIINHVGC